MIFLILLFTPGAFSHGFTYSGHPVPCAVAIEALKIYKYVAFLNHFLENSQSKLRAHLLVCIDYNGQRKVNYCFFF